MLVVPPGISPRCTGICHVLYRCEGIRAEFTAMSGFGEGGKRFPEYGCAVLLLIQLAAGC
jgi:hypothetical protein